MGTLVRTVVALSAIGYGVNIFEQAPPGAINGVRTDLVGVVADLPWGAPNTMTPIASTAELFAAFCPPEFGAENSYPALRAFLNKSFPGGLRIVRIDATSAAKATSGAVTAGTGSITITAKYKGAIGNGISYQFVTATGGDAAKRDLIITIGSRYSARYTDLAHGSITTAVDDPFVDVTSATPSAMPATMGSATALTSGSNGTAVAADYVGSISSAVGIRKFYAESIKVAALFVAECPSGLVNAVNAGLYAYATEADKGMVVLCTPDGATAAATITDAASYRDDRVVYTWPRVKTVNFYDPDNAEIEVDGNAFAAAAIVSVDPEVSPGGAPGAPFLKGITGLEDEDVARSTYDDLNAAGVAPFQMTDALGCIIRKGITTSLTSGLTQIFRRRMTDFVLNSIADRAQNFVSRPLDVDLAGQSVGPSMGGLVSECHGFLGELLARIRIAAYSVDPFSRNLQSNLNAGRWYLAIRVKLISAADEIVLVAGIGESIEITD